MFKVISGLALILISVIWGFSFTVVKTSVADYGIYSFLSLRFFLGAFCLVPFCIRIYCKKRKILTGASHSEWNAGLTSSCAVKNKERSLVQKAGIALLIGLCLGGAFIAQTAGTRSVSASLCSLITSLYAPFAVLLGLFLFKIQVRKEIFFILPLSLLGLYLVAGLNSEQNLSSVGDVSSVQGTFLVLIGAFLFGLHVVLLSQFSREFHPLTLTAVQLLTVAFVTGFLAILLEPLVLPDAAVWSGILVCGIFCSAVCYIVQTTAQIYLSNVQTSFLMSLEPVFGTLFGVLLMGDVFSRLQMTGGILIILSTLIMIPFSDSPVLESKNAAKTTVKTAVKPSPKRQ